jgi:transcription antitermination factor NusG
MYHLYAAICNLLNAWLLIYTNPLSERLVYNQLLQRNYLPYLPLTIITRNKEKIVFPLFSRYLFVKQDQKQNQLRRIPGITELVSFQDDHEPILIQDDIIQELKQRELDGIIQTELIACEPLYDQNDEIRITNGPFQGMLATFDKQLPKNHAKVLLSFFGRTSEINISLSDIVAANNYKAVNAQPAYLHY